MTVLDITKFSEKGKRLKVAINDACKQISKSVLPELPDVIKMTTKQYGYLSMSEQMLDMYNPEQYLIGQGQEFYMYRTPFCVMEVEVVDGLLDVGIKVESASNSSPDKV